MESLEYFYISATFIIFIFKKNYFLPDVSATAAIITRPVVRSL